MYTMLYVSTIYSEYYYVRNKEAKKREDLLNESVIQATEGKDLPDDKNEDVNTDFLDLVDVSTFKLGEITKETLARKLHPELSAINSKINNLLAVPKKEAPETK
jgi:hypothetical protein